MNIEQARAGTIAVARLSLGNLRGLLRGVIRVVSLGAPLGKISEQDMENEIAAQWAMGVVRPSA
jgi:hypothetical protein